MTVKPFAAAFASLLLLGASSSGAVRAEEWRVAELVPGSEWPSTGLPFPMGQLPVPALENVPAPPPDPEPAATARKDGPAVLEHGWEGGPSKDKDGNFAYCVVEGQYDTGHALMLARNARGELNVGIGIPGAELPKDEQWPVEILVDGKLKRERTAVAPQRDMLVIANGRDEELYDALMNGNQFIVTSAADRIGFTLKGTKRALADLRTCVEKSGQVPPFKPVVVSEKVKAGAAALPAPLMDLLAAAGLEEIEPIGFGQTPPEQRAADFAWRYGPIFGGVRESAVKEGAKLTDLSDEFAGSMKARCGGKATVAFTDQEDLPEVSLRTGSVECATEKGVLHVSLLFFLSPDRLFTVIFHEAAETDRQLADKATGNIARVIRTVAAEPAETGAGDKSASDKPKQN
ncbi:hypothetical protein [Azospirillum sp. SYSU D00513]|uniref:hypothetical protein n=1 Tax=Azospirillum sp. SYSU D00513 TaxID=2812561 RepID=UPI001A96C4C1|nr:hypothetical protein [Azospirillum sp. SYSU D00513]